MHESTSHSKLPSFFQTDTSDEPASKMTKRDWIAAMCLQGILANKNATKTTMWSTAQSAVMYADQLIAALETDMPTGVPMVQPPAFSGIPIPVVAGAVE